MRLPGRVGDGRAASASTSAWTGPGSGSVPGSDGPVRVADAAEYGAIGQLTATAYAGGDVDEPDSYLEVLRDPASRPADCTVLAVDDPGGALLAATTSIPAGSTVSQVARPGEAELRMLAVRADARGRGVGGRLVQAALDRARAESRSALVLCVIDHNAGARALYERIGFACPGARLAPRSGDHPRRLPVPAELTVPRPRGAHAAGRSGAGVEGARWGAVSVRRASARTAAAGRTEVAAVATGRPARALRALRTLRWRSIWDHHDVAVAYAAVVLVVAVVIAVEPAAAAHRVVQQSSTNLVNLRSHPLMVLVVSAFVVSPVWGLVILVPLVAAYGALQAWLGRVSAVVIGVVGHVGATLFVATLEVTALTRNRVGFAVVRDADVGVSYGLATVVGLLAARVPAVWRRRYLAGSAVVMAVQLVALQGFTALGHLVAWAVGVGLAVPVHRAAAAAAHETHPPDGR